MASLKSVRGLSWGTSAISNATWTGVKLSDVLAYAGAKEEQVEHVHLQGKQLILIYCFFFNFYPEPQFVDSKTHLSYVYVPQ